MDSCNALPHRQAIEKECFYTFPAFQHDDIICLGSDTEESVEETKQKHLRYEEQARRYVAGKIPIIQSANLRGPLSGDEWVWDNPWRYSVYHDDGGNGKNSPLEVEETKLEMYTTIIGEEKIGTGNMAVQDLEEDWWHPGSEKMLFTRRNVLKRAAMHGFGHLTPIEALQWCQKEAADEVIRRGNVSTLMIRSVEGDEAGKSTYNLYNRVLEDDESSATSAITTHFHARDGAIISEHHDDEIHPEHTSQSIEIHIPERTEKDVNWLKGMHITGHAQWNYGRITSPTPRPIVPDKHRAWKSSPTKSSRHRYGSTNQFTSVRDACPPAALGKGSKLRAESVIDHGKSTSDLALMSESYVRPNKEAGQELIGNVDQEPGLHEGINSTTLYAESRRRSIDPDKYPSDLMLEDDRLNSVATQSKDSAVWSSAIATHRQDYTSGELPELLLDSASAHKSSFVTEVAPSSRNMEEFTFKKKRKRKLVVDAEFTLHNVEDIESKKKSRVFDFETHTTVPGVRRTQSEGNSITGPKRAKHIDSVQVPHHDTEPTLDGSNSTSRSLPDEMDSYFNPTNGLEIHPRAANEVDESSLDFETGSTHTLDKSYRAKEQPLSLPEDPSCHVQQALVHSSSPTPPTLTRSAKPHRNSLPEVDACTLEYSSQRPPAKANSPNARSPSNYSLKKLALPRFDWEDGTEMTIKGMGDKLPKACPVILGRGSPQSAKGAGLNSISEQQQCYLEDSSESASDLGQTAQLFGQDDTTDESPARTDLTSHCQPQQWPYLPEAPDKAEDDRECLPIGEIFSDRPSSLPLSKRHSLSECHARWTCSAQLLPPMQQPSSGNMALPISSFNENDISTQSFNTSPIKSQRRAIVNAETASPIPGTRDSTTRHTLSSAAQSDIAPVTLGNMEPSYASSGQPTKISQPISRSEEVTTDDVASDESSKGTTCSKLETPVQQTPFAADYSEQVFVPRTDEALVVDSDFEVHRRSSIIPGDNIGDPQPQSPWIVDPFPDLLQVDTTEEFTHPCAFDCGLIPKIDDANSLVDQSLDVHEGEKSQVDSLPELDLRTPMPTPTPNTKHKGKYDSSTLRSQRTPQTVGRNPWASCLRSRSPRKLKKRVSFHGLYGDQEDRPVTNNSHLHPASPPPPERAEDSDEENVASGQRNKKHFVTVSRYTQILPDHVHSQDIYSSPALGAQAEAFIAADGGTSAEQTLRGPSSDVDARFLQPRSKSSDNAIWGTHNEQSPFRIQSPSDRKTGSTSVTLPGFDMDKALGEIGSFLADWSVEAELKKANVPAAQSVVATGVKRRRLFGLS